MDKIVTRFAPSPTGHLHLGGARTALFNWLLARHYNGKFILRIENTDILRSKEEYTRSILDSMRWLGLDWDGELTYQADRSDLYNKYVDKLLETGHAYWCACTPEEIEKGREEARAKGLKPKYDGHCRELGLGPGPGRCVRLKAPLSGKIVFDDMVKGSIATDVKELDDMIIRRSDGIPTYNLAVVVDDHSMGVTHVLRGDDHVPNTPKQILIYQALDWPIPVFGHIPMILGPDKKKLSKRHGAKAVIEYEQDGLLPEALDNYLARLGWSHGDQEIFSKDELIRYFDGKNLNSSSAAFDPKKLDWCNAQFIRHMPLQELANALVPFLKTEGIWEAIGSEPEKRVMELCLMFRERASDLSQMAKLCRPLLSDASDLSYDDKALKKHFIPASWKYLNEFAALLEKLPEFTPEAIEETLNAYVRDNDLQFKEVAPPIRVALMGYMGGSHLNEIMAFLGKKETLARLARATELCKN